MSDYPDKLFGIIGFPLGHSLSPALQNWAFRTTGYPGVYMSWPIEPGKLGAFFQAVRILPVSGGNITIPYKIESVKLVDKISERVKSIGAMNTWYWRDGELWGENTDVTGFIAPLKNYHFASALCLGAGGASRAVIAGMKELKIPEITVTNRSFKKARELGDVFHVHAIPWDERMNCRADLVVNATSMGMKGEQADKNPYEKAWMEGRKGMAYDIVYNPLQTLFLEEARAAGWKTETGLAMFVEQARAAFALWTGGLEMPRADALARAKKLLGI